MGGDVQDRARKSVGQRIEPFQKGGLRRRDEGEFGDLGLSHLHAGGFTQLRLGFSVLWVRPHGFTVETRGPLEVAQAFGEQAL